MSQSLKIEILSDESGTTIAGIPLNTIEKYLKQMPPDEQLKIRKELKLTMTGGGIVGGSFTYITCGVIAFLFALFVSETIEAHGNSAASTVESLWGAAVNQKRCEPRGWFSPISTEEARSRAACGIAPRNVIGKSFVATLSNGVQAGVINKPFLEHLCNTSMGFYAMVVILSTLCLKLASMCSEDPRDRERENIQFNDSGEPKGGKSKKNRRNRKSFKKR
jgi:hypothetical protein